VDFEDGKWKIKTLFLSPSPSRAVWEWSSGTIAHARILGRDENAGSAIALNSVIGVLLCLAVDSESAARWGCESTHWRGQCIRIGDVKQRKSVSVACFSLRD
jgi:hypothetical protein